MKKSGTRIAIELAAAAAEGACLRLLGPRRPADACELGPAPRSLSRRLDRRSPG